MRERAYYSVRTGKIPGGGRLDLPAMRELFVDLYRDFEFRGFFQQTFGYHCVDSGFEPGDAGYEVQRFVFRKLRKRGVWPPSEHERTLTEDDIFDLMELLFDYVSKGVDGYYHNFSECGWHYRSFNRSEGRKEIRAAFNEILRDYADGYHITVDGDVVHSAPVGLSELETAQPAPIDEENVTARVRDAVAKFRKRGAGVEERRDAIRDLADVLEYLRPLAKGILTKRDDADLFEIANSFGIRHHNQRQKTKFERRIWYSWMYYYYLTTIHALTRLIERPMQEE